VSVSCGAAQVLALVVVNNLPETTSAADTAMPDTLENLEPLIDAVLQNEGPMTLAELINLIAQPYRFDRFCLGAA
jgi:hypothetical protein